MAHIAYYGTYLIQTKKLIRMKMRRTSMTAFYYSQALVKIHVYVGNVKREYIHLIKGVAKRKRKWN